MSSGLEPVFRSFNDRLKPLEQASFFLSRQQTQVTCLRHSPLGRRFLRLPRRCERCALAMWSSLQQKYEAVFKPLKPLISNELAVFLFHGRVFSQGVFRGCSRFYEHGVFRVFRGVFTVRGVHPLCSFIFRFSLQTSVPTNWNLYHKTINIVPAPIRIHPIIDLRVNSSCRKTNASISVMTTDNLSIGTTLEASPICKAL